MTTPTDDLESLLDWTTWSPELQRLIDLTTLDTIRRAITLEEKTHVATVLDQIIAPLTATLLTAEAARVVYAIKKKLEVIRYGFSM